ncbi:glycine cleavage system protein GcvH [Ferrovum myxofaciens]|jgi:glycine cleavage system H protein|uniref:Glycine cleavage system H protein n=3 Tax=root TaxID=1 RepID=A0A859A9M9_9PROT|nr:glycine cleavage system protein GcvH [Ferrovum myxofaciens]KXW58761.1 glycine cleavage system H protein [Ferrovum myxofaciens]MBU6994912.1 glycine cleavage system protein GcvH [Ferrovum myxofaciens]QKE38720.1 MAG: glycine cleavage system protein GcvH [Ferrovum myxofaciens]QKE41283.1 MAG: glycine cleavage system protein GcvH [Ferrovum myxofaciens]QWY73924.1 MAG: glycine cleavage system protein GcvH [Ferrovum myxofaciens]
MLPPNDRRYSATHQWVQPSAEGTLAIGITDFAQDQLGDLMFVELASVGRTLKAGESCATLESVKTASEVPSPVGGTVHAINDSLKDHPEVLNTEPYDHWLVKITPHHAEDYTQLLTAEDYQHSV